MVSPEIFAFNKTLICPVDCNLDRQIISEERTLPDEKAAAVRFGSGNSISQG
jgi:hypothetical protein